MVNKQRKVCQRGGDGSASDTQSWDQGKCCYYGDTETNKRSVKIEFGLASTGEKIGQNGVGGEKDDARSHQQDNTFNVTKLA